MSSARVAFANKEETLASVRRWLSGLARSRREILRAVVFGSYARGDYHPRSDVDLLLVLGDHPEPFHRRIAEYLPDGIGVPVEIFPYTQAEVAARLAEGDPWLGRILKEGVEIYKRDEQERSDS